MAKRRASSSLLHQQMEQLQCSAPLTNTLLLRQQTQNCSVAQRTLQRMVVRSRREAQGTGAQGQVKTGQENETKEGGGRSRPKEKFVWDEHWYPVAVLRDLNPKVPEAVTILGHPMVLWFDPSSQHWRIFNDSCPHRLAPLSEGRVDENGHLQCSYHGWSFASDGSCAHIPQAPLDGPPVQRSPRACAKVYPSKEHQGMLWVYPNSSPSAAPKAASTPLPVVPALDDPSFHPELSTNDIQYGYEMLVENLVDPAHVHFAHHSLNRANRNMGRPLELSVEEVTVNGIKGTRTKGFPGSFRFEAPCLSTTEVIIPNAPGKEQPPKKGVSVFFCIPMEPGRSRVIAGFPSNISNMPSIIPRWLRHLTQMKVIVSDLYLLHVLERNLKKVGGPAAARLVYYMPTRSDSYVAAFHRWFSEFSNSKVDYAPGTNTILPPTPPREQLLHRQAAHVRLCGSCQAAQHAFTFLQRALAVLSLFPLAFLLTKSASRAAPLPLHLTLSALAFAAFAALASWLLLRFVEKNYVFEDYVHALVP